MIFSWQLNRLSERATLKQTVPWIILNLIFSLYVIWAGFLSGGIKYDATTSWIPVFSTNFAIISLIMVSVYLLLPHTILSFRLLKTFKGEVKTRVTQYILSVYLEFLIVYWLIIYNTWVDNQVIEVITFIINVPASMLAAYFIYKSLVSQLG